jgi:hypothetical protein
MDHLVPTIAQGLPGEFGMEPGLGSVASNYAKSGTVLAAYLYADHLTSIEKPGPGIDPKLNGYSDYLFFQYLARTKGPDTIKQIFDAWPEAEQRRGDRRGRRHEVGLAAFARTLWMAGRQGARLLGRTRTNTGFGLAQVYAQVLTDRRIPRN